MGERAGALPPNPVPAEPSTQSVRLLRRRQRGGRMDSFSPKGIRLALMRTMIRAIDRAGRLPKDVTSERDGAGLWLRPGGVASANGVLLYLHGGGFVFPPVHRVAVSAYVRPTGLPAYLPSYRRAPEHPFPAAADDVLAAYRMLLDTGYPAAKIRLAGDSSGGFLATALLRDLERAGLPMPARVLLLSPLVDLSAASAYRCDVASRDPASSPRLIEATSRAYAADTPMTDPRLDVLAADKQGWPPVLIQTGGTECITGENELLAESVRSSGAQCELQIWPGQYTGSRSSVGTRSPKRGRRESTRPASSVFPRHDRATISRSAHVFDECLGGRFIADRAMASANVQLTVIVYPGA